MKTKPTQTATRILNEVGIQPDIILGRSQLPLDEPRKRKISVFCNVQKEDVISAPDVDSIYEVPLLYEKEDIGERILEKFNIRPKKKDLKEWKRLVARIKNSKKPVEIGIVGKYFKTGEFTLMDSYISVIEAIKHACWFFKKKPQVHWLSAEKYEKYPRSLRELKKYDGVIVPGGFGNRGTEGKIKAIKFLRENKIPFLGLCLGMQLAVVEFARNVCNMKGANSSEFNKKTPYPVIDVIPGQEKLLKEKKYGATMRLGAYRCKLKKGSKSYQAYGGKSYIYERHRHRYEFNNDFKEEIEKKGMIMAGVNPKKNLVEIVEVKNHPFFVASQFHPEFTSSPLNPNPLFKSFISACIKKQR